LADHYCSFFFIYEKKKESLKIPKWHSEDVNRKYKEKRTIMICQTLHRKNVIRFALIHKKGCTCSYIIKIEINVMSYVETNYIIPKWHSEDVNRKYKEKRTIMICQTLHRNERLSTKNPIEHWG
jgi:hypothetical protein